MMKKFIEDKTVIQLAGLGVLMNFIAMNIGFILKHIKVPVLVELCLRGIPFIIMVVCSIKIIIKFIQFKRKNNTFK